MIKRLLRLVGRWARKPVNHTSWVAVVTPTDRPKSVRNRCVIELFCGVVLLSLCLFDISVGVGAFVIGLSQISSFFSYSSETCVKDFNGSKIIIRIVFNVFILCVLKKRCLQIFTISLPINVYQINFIQWFYENGRSKDKSYAKTNNFESDIFRVW